MSYLTTIWEALARASLEGGIALLVIFGFCRLCKSVPGRIQCWLWRLALAKLFFTLLWTSRIEVPLLSASPISPEPAYVEPRESMPASELPQYQILDTMRAIPRDPLSLRQWLVILWMGGAGTVSASIVLQWLRARHLRQHFEPVRDESVLLAASEICRTYGIATLPSIGATELSPMPLLLGPWRPMLLLPKNLLDNIDPKSLRVILAHELAHLRRRDLLWAWLPALAQIVFFFHPLVWLIRREHRSSQELACDEMAIRATASGVAVYAETLLNIVATQSWTRESNLFSAGIVENKQALKRRISSMKFIQFAVRRRFQSAILLLVGLLNVIPARITAGNQVQAEPGQAAAKPAVTPPLAEPAIRPAARPAALSARRPGVVEKLFFREGDKVTKGALLLQIDDSEIRAGLETARARFRLAEATFNLEQVDAKQAIRDIEHKRQEVKAKLLSAAQVPDENSVQARLARAEAEFDLAKSQLAEAEVELKHYRIHSPRDGTILRLEAEEGESVTASPEKPLIVIGDPAELARVANASLQSLVDKLIKQELEMAATYTPSHPLLMQLRSRIAAYRTQLDGNENREIFVVGEVNKPGAILLRPAEELTVLGALARAGGFTNRGDKRKIKVARPGETERVFTLDELKNPTNHFILQPGDFVEVADKIL